MNEKDNEPRGFDTSKLKFNIGDYSKIPKDSEAAAEFTEEELEELFNTEPTEKERKEFMSTTGSFADRPLVNQKDGEMFPDFGSGEETEQKEVDSNSIKVNLDKDDYETEYENQVADGTIGEEFNEEEETTPTGYFVTEEPAEEEEENQPTLADLITDDNTEEDDFTSDNNQNNLSDLHPKMIYYDMDGNEYDDSEKGMRKLQGKVEGLEFTFDIKDKYNDAMKAITGISKFTIAKCDPEMQRMEISEVLFQSINIETGKINIREFKRLSECMFYAPDKQEEIYKIIVKALPEDIKEDIPTRSMPNFGDFFDDEDEQDDFNEFKINTKACTLGYLTQIYNPKEFNFVELKAKGGKYICSVVISVCEGRNYIRQSVGSMIGTMAKLNKNFNVRAVILRNIYHMKDDSYIEEVGVDCKWGWSERPDFDDTLNGSLKEIYIMNLEKTFSIDTRFDIIKRFIIFSKMDELKIPVMDMGEKLDVEFKLELTPEIADLAENVNKLNNILHANDITSVRKALEQEFLAVGIDSPSLAYMFDNNIDCKVQFNQMKKHERDVLLDDIIEAFGIDSPMYRIVGQALYAGFNKEFRDGQVIEWFLKSIDTVQADEIERNIWHFSCNTSYLSRYQVAELFRVLSNKGNSFLDTYITLNY